MPVTQKDIAMLIGISRQAVAAALDGDGSSRVSEKTREKVLKLARELNYIPNAAARKLSGGSSRSIGIIASLGMPHGNTVHAEVCQILRSSGYLTFTVDYASGDIPQLCSQLASCGVAGIIIMDCLVSPRDLHPLPDLPIVFCRARQGMSDIDVDKEAIGYTATRHLLEHNRERIYFLGSHNQSNTLREQGWARALKESGKSGKSLSLNSGGGKVKVLIELLKQDKVDGLFCSNDFIAAKVMRALIANGIRVPEDIAMAGCDGCSLVEFTTPSLTTMVQPVHELAQQCVDIMLERIEKGISGVVLEKRVICSKLWLGGSCGCCDHAPELLYRLNTTGNLEKDYRLNFNISPWDKTISGE